MQRWAAVLGCVPLLLLVGCPQQRAAAPGKVAAQATAPALPGSQQAATEGQDRAAFAEHAARVEQVIQRAERAYHSGVENYRNGHLDAARMDFDAAVDGMLTSGMDLKHDPQLADEFEHLLDAVNSLEMSALKQGNGFSPTLEAAPLDAADEVTFPANGALTAQLAAELKTTQSDFPLVVNDYVAGFISYFTNSPGGHAHLLRSLERAGRYKDMISKNLREAGVPQDLMYLAVAESGFQPQALNARSGAGGMWQFMPTGAYGLQRNGWFDERFDPEKSSKAYARYMKSLYLQFGDWYLAMAAYNWGPGYVQRAVMKTGYADFWELYRRNMLPAETKNYVPGIIAAIIMAKNPTQYGLDRIVPDPPVESDTVTVDYAVDLRLVADVTGASLAEIVGLNPSLLRMATPSDLPFDLHLPVGTREAYEERIKSIPEEKRATWRFHVVKPGETLEEIATALRVRPAEVAEVNQLGEGAVVAAGDELVIPVAPALAAPVRTQHYTVRRSDTLVTVADRFNVTVEQLRSWNHLRSSKVKPGQSLTVAAPVRLAPMTHVRNRRAHGADAGTSVASRGGRHAAAVGSKHGGSAASGKSSGKASGKSSAKAGSGKAAAHAHSAGSGKSSTSSRKKHSVAH
ncbi:MAG: transglycosylase SLT domain-containing protein [Acidobacteriota bacterium]|nr:transglycosylase SLT domain-containing protein [Acidobacteriota bacterium]